MSTAGPSPLPDRIGIALSGLCLLHCVALPLGLSVLPVLAATWLDGLAGATWFHAALLVPVVLVSGFVLGRRALDIAWLGPLLALALGAMTAALFVEGEGREQALTVGGASFLMLAHWLNMRAPRRT